MASRILLSPPDLAGDEIELVQEAIRSGWVAPLGPMVDAFEREFAEVVGAKYAVALSSGTAALHLALIDAGVEPGDEVATSSLTFAATAFAIRYVGATPVFIDSEPRSWNLDPELLATWLDDRGRRNRLPKAVIPVHLYGQTADRDAILETCRRWGVTVIEDAAEALGATYRGHPPGNGARCAAWSFNGNKMITTGGGGMLTTDDPRVEAHVRKLATQAREPVLHYEHAEIGYNYRLSNVSAAIGLAQLRTLDRRVRARRAHFEAYQRDLADLPALTFQEEMGWGTHSRWLTCCLLDRGYGLDRQELLARLSEAGVEARPVWKPMHEQPIFATCTAIGGLVSSMLFKKGLCLPSGSGLTEADRDRVISAIREAFSHETRRAGGTLRAEAQPAR
jgi:dTDP-4-amino-4,6-dideoxygalactose transaminase